MAGPNPLDVAAEIRGSASSGPVGLGAASTSPVSPDAATAVAAEVAVAARYGAVHLALGVATAAAVLRELAVPGVGAGAAAVIGVGLGAAVELLHIPFRRRTNDHPVCAGMAGPRRAAAG